MKPREVLKLTASQASIKKIMKHLQESEVDSPFYLDIVFQLASFYFEDGNFGYCFQILEDYLYKVLESDRMAVLDKLIDYNIEIDNILNLERYVNMKKSLLDISDLKPYYKDMIRIYKTRDINIYIENLELYLADHITTDERLELLYMLLNAFYEVKNFESLASKIDLAKQLALELKNQEYYDQFIYLDAMYTYNSDQFDATLDLIKNVELVSLHHINLLRVLELKINLQRGNYRRCTILESKYEEDILNDTDDVKRDFFKVCIDLYTKQENKFSLGVYKDRLLALESNVVVEEVVEEVKKPSKIKKLEVITEEDLEEKKPIKVVKEPVKKRLVEKVVVDNKFHTLELQDNALTVLGKTFGAFSGDFTLRDKIRYSLIYLNEHVSFTDCFLLYETSPQFHFKKERMYNKNLEIRNTLYESIKGKEELMSFNTTEDKLVDPMTGDIFTNNESLIGFPLHRDGKLLGIVYFLGTDSKLLEDKLNYEILLSYSVFINSMLNMFEERRLEQHDNYKDQTALANTNLMYMIFKLGYVTSSSVVAKEFGVAREVSQNEFVSKISVDYFFDYMKSITELQESDTSYNEVIFQFRDSSKMYKQRNFKVLEDGNVAIYATIEDKTLELNNEEKLFRLIKLNQASGLKNKVALEEDVVNYFNSGKFSAFIINFVNLKKYSYLYGYKFSEDVIKALGKVLHSYDNKLQYYHLNYDKMVVVLEGVNDIRAIKKIISKVDKFLQESMKSINKRLDSNYTFGVYRYPSDSKEKSANKVISILSESLLNVNEYSDDNVGVYDVDIYKARFLKEQLITYISESLDNASIEVNYSQVINFKHNIVQMYKASLNINEYSVSDEMLKEVIVEKGMTKILEKYLIHKTVAELNIINEKTNLMFDVMFELSDTTLIDKNFITFLEEQVSYFKIPRSSVVLQLNTILSSCLDNVKELMEKGYMICVKDIDALTYIKPSFLILNTFEKLNVFNSNYTKSLSTLCTETDVKVILDGVEEQNIIEHFKDFINLYSGKIYSNKLTYLEILDLFK